MCIDCGCSDGAKATVTNMKTGAVSEIWKDVLGTLHREGRVHSHDHDHNHAHPHTHSHTHGHGDGHNHTHPHDHAHGVGHDHHHHDHSHSHDHGIVSLEQAILSKNDRLAAQNRAWLSGREVLMLNLVSSPGSGKTSLLERSIRDLKGKIDVAVIEGDQATANDGARIASAGAPAIQVNTGTGCHLEADMIERGLKELRPKFGSVVFVENVGNLVCPALFDLGEAAKVAILSVTEGEDKPLKYPHMFRAASLVLLNKVDLLPYLDFDVEKAIAYAREVNPSVTVIQTSAKTGAGMEMWYDWIGAQRKV